jgi:hypothetical protein
VDGIQYPERFSPDGLTEHVIDALLPLLLAVAPDDHVAVGWRQRV